MGKELSGKYKRNNIWSNSRGKIKGATPPIVKLPEPDRVDLSGIPSIGIDLLPRKVILKPILNLIEIPDRREDVPEPRLDIQFGGGTTNF